MRDTLRKSSTGFTLIELLIVVAIIAILAAIAVPNFLEAQTRAKVSRAKSDMRTLATAIESYYVDNNKFPLAIVDAPYAPTYAAANRRYCLLVTLTSPIAYITSFPVDAFEGDYRGSILPDDARIYYDYRRTYLDTVSGQTTLQQIATGLGFNVNEQPTSWLLYSPGPDKEQNINTKLANKGTVPVSGFGDPLGTWPYYDPTNGTISWGDVIRSSYGDESTLAGR